MPSSLHSRPGAFSAFTTPAFWDDPHISAQMLALHLDPDAVPASRPHAFIDRSVAWLVDVLDLHPGSRVLDLGCGPGLYACRLARQGIAVTGLDVSRRSIAHACAVADAEQLPATFWRSDYLQDDLGCGYDAAILIYEDFCALSPARRAGLLGRTREALNPGGAFIMDVTAAPRFDRERPGVVRERDLGGGFWAPSPYVGTRETWLYAELRLVLDRYTIDTGSEVRQFWNWLHCLTPTEVATELVAAGLGEPELFGDVAGAPFDPTMPTFTVVARAVPAG